MEYIVGDYSEFMPVDNANNNNNAPAHFTVDDLLNFSKEDETMTDGFFESNSVDSSTVTAVDSCNSSVSGSGDAQFNGNVSCHSFNDSQFSGNELCVPYDAELEWLSNFVEESFSTEDLHFIPTTAIGAKPTTNATYAPPPPPFHPSEVSVPGKARSKRSRIAPCDWSSRLLHLSASTKKREPVETPGRKCLHCASEKTPQWRTGPMGPKTLCNACGVRYKSGRLVPEYRPASSPTFVSAKHSNSHRKVLELRRQKEVRTHHPNPMMMGPVYSNGCDDQFMIHHQHHHHRGSISGQDFRHMI